MENYKTLMKEFKADLNKWIDIPSSWTSRLNIAKISFLYNLIYTFNIISVKILPSCFVYTDKVILKFK